MILRVSSYTFAAPLSDGRHSLLAHGVTGALDRVSLDISSWVTAHRGHEIDPGQASISAPVLARLTERGYLTELSEDTERSMLVEVSRQLHRADLQSKIPSYCFVPTYLCNLRCPYCFQSHDLHAGVGGNNQVLTSARIEAAFRIIDAYSFEGSVAQEVGLLDEPGPRDSQAPPAPIGLFGGEPLMGACLGAVREICDRAGQRGLGVWGITNGVELAAYRDLLGTGPGRISELQITVDGLPHRHNKRRRGPEFERTFDTIMTNIDLALARGTAISVRMNTDQSNASDIEELASIFGERGWNDSDRFTFYCAVVTRKGGKSTFDHASLVDETLRHRKNGVDVKSYERTAENFLRNLIAAGPDALPFTGTAHCSAESGQLMFDSRGDVYACWEDVGIRSHRVGTYDGAGLHLDDQPMIMWLEREPGRIEQCSKCPYALIHTSGCGSQARLKNGTIYASECEEFQTYFPRSLAVVYEEFEQSVLRVAETG